ncbi:uncharacterized protein [Miscanthus floridulus]|uniref:uncharacterized protein n=1 Tax=Miscanthus floridulus TaxID=154761 RepID=UPI00345781A2
MTKRKCVETIDRSLQDIIECALPFEGKIMVFGGDFSQVLHVVPRETRAQITDATVQRSYLWEKVRKIRLSRNMRAQSDPWFSEYLLRIGNGTEETIGDDYVQLPDDIVIGYTDMEVAINKLRGQTIPNVGIYLGIYLPEPVFSHGQLYVGLSRGISRSTTRILAKPKEELDPTGKSTKNIVYKDVLIW